VKVSDIKIGHIYSIDYEPVRNGEFNGKHLSVVLKKNNDNKTFIVMPLTSSPNGDGVNKVNIGKIAGLPPSLSGKDTYAVFNQVRTVNASRFYAIKKGQARVSISLSNATWLSLFEFAMRDMLFDVGQDDRISALKTVCDRERFEKAKDLAYTVIKLRKANTAEDKIAELLGEISNTLKDVAYALDAMQIADGIETIFEEALTPIAENADD
jgi:uncharacterized protein YifN (PemK superfamily)